MEELIYFESQDAALCAVHSINNLLQGQYFSEVDLATIAHELDRKEREAFAEGGTDTPEYIQFIGQKSQNLADEGYFSVQVIEEALKVWNLSLLQFNSEEAANVRLNPANEQGFICNYQTHWFSIRKIGNSFWNLNSLFKNPEKVSFTFLAMLLRQLQLEGYSIFVVTGSDLPPSPAEVVGESREEEDEDLERAIQMSLEENSRAQPDLEEEEESAETMRSKALAAALKRMES